jgi:hypothetical protein
MSGKKKASRRFAVCIRNEGNEASLERNKLYVILRIARPTPTAWFASLTKTARTISTQQTGS